MAATETEKVALVTGANRGIGLETARQLAQAGILPVIGARDRTAGAKAVAVLGREGLTAHALPLDVTSAADRSAAADFLRDRYGRLDILINNAGVHMEGEPGVEHLYSASTTPTKVLRDTMEVNFFSLVALTDEMLPLIRKSAAGRIVNVSTILASLTLMADPASPIYEMKSLAYDTSKVAINSYTVHLAHELSGSGIKVNSAHPGWVRTDMGGRHAMIDIVTGARTSVALAQLADDGPTGGFFHLGDPVPW